MIEMADSGKDQSRGVLQLRRRRRPPSLNPQPLEEIQEGLDVAHSVVDDPNHRKYLFSSLSRPMIPAPNLINQRLFR